MRVLVTGANGFVGRALCSSLVEQGFDVYGALRKNINLQKIVYDTKLVGLNDVHWAVIGDIGVDTDWEDILKGVDCVVHLAARAHILKETCKNSLSAYRQVNVDGTRRLARLARECKVKRFIYISTIGVHGRATLDEPFNEQSPINPQDDYALSKYEGELSLLDETKDSGLETVILRLPLVYGPGVGGNFLRLLKLVDKGIIMPFKNFNNRRSLLALGNLISTICLCLSKSQAANKIFLLSDADAVSTSGLVVKIAKAMNRKARFLPVSDGFVNTIAKLLGRQKDAQRLLGSLLVDSSKIVRELEWRPEYTIEQYLRITVEGYLSLCKQ